MRTCLCSCFACMWVRAMAGPLGVGRGIRVSGKTPAQIAELYAAQLRETMRLNRETRVHRADLCAVQEHRDFDEGAWWNAE